jgi:trehalose 6-phosphate phosphatase
LAALGRLAPRLARAAIITGRPAEDVARLVGATAWPGLDALVILGQYGAERWEAGHIKSPAPDSRVVELRKTLPDRLRALNAPKGVAVEDKGNALAVHTRRARDPAGAFAALQPPLAELAAQRGLRLEPGRYVLELRPPGMDKGTALRGLVADSRPDSVVYAGDDLGDLAAFDAVDEMRIAGQSGLLVCSGSAEVVALRARADLVVDGPGGVAEFLESLADAIGADE